MGRPVFVLLPTAARYSLRRPPRPLESAWRVKMGWLSGVPNRVPPTAAIRQVPFAAYIAQKSKLEPDE